MKIGRRAAILSLLFMGWGQIYNRQYFKGMLFALGEVVFFASSQIWFQALQGLVTMGETPSEIKDGRMVPGDHSIFLMVIGIISLILVLLFLSIYAVNVRDAYRNGIRRQKGMIIRSFAQSATFTADKGYPYLLLFPAFILLLFFTVLPIVFGILIAFTNYSGPYHLPPGNLVSWVGLDTFVHLFGLKTWSSTFYKVAAWTFIWATLSTASTFLVGLIVAVLVQHPKVHLKKMWRTIFIIPYAVPGFISILIMRNLFNGSFGPINRYLEAMGLAAIPWFSHGMVAKGTVLLVNLWIAFPYFMFMMTGILTGISKDLYEAASVDGASGINKFTRITLPLVLYATTPLIIMNFAINLNNFNLVYLLTEGNPVNSSLSYAGDTDILLSWIFKLTLEQNQYNMAAAISILVFVIIAVFSIYNYRRTKTFKEGGWLQ